MPKRFFKRVDDVSFPQRWDLDTPRDRQGRKVDDAQFRIGAPVRIKGRL